MTPKEFALKTIAPYYSNPSTCGFNGISCLYLTEDGRKCAVGKYLVHPEAADNKQSLREIFKLGFDMDTLVQSPELIEEAQDMLTLRQ